MWINARRLLTALADASPAFRLTARPPSEGFGRRLLLAMSDSSPAFARERMGDGYRSPSEEADPEREPFSERIVDGGEEPAPAARPISESSPSFWGALTPSERAALEEAGRSGEYAAGSLLSRQGEDPDHVLIILDGWVKMTAGRAGGHEVTLAIRGPHDTIGESVWLSGRPQAANVKALNRVRVLAIPSEQFAGFLNTYPHAAQVLARATAGRMDDADRRMTSRAGASGPKLLAMLLLDLAERYGEPSADGTVTLPLPLTQHELAVMIGRARETVARALTAWRREGVVVTRRMRIVIRDLDALREVVDDSFQKDARRER